MVQKQVSEAPTPLEHFRPDLPSWCYAIVNRALAKSPDDRFQSADEFRYALLAAEKPETLGELPTLATPTPPGLRVDGMSASGPRTAPTAPRELAAVPGTPESTAPSPARSPHERTTTVVLGRTHLVALAALILVLAAGVAALAVAAFRARTAPAQAAAVQALSEQPSAPPVDVPV